MIHNCKCGGRVIHERDIMNHKTRALTAIFTCNKCRKRYKQGLRMAASQPEKGKE